MILERAPNTAVDCVDAQGATALLAAAGLHHAEILRLLAGAYTRPFQLNLSALHGIGGVRKGLCSPCYGGVRGCLGCVECYWVSETAQVELNSERV